MGNFVLNCVSQQDLVNRTLVTRDAPLRYWSIIAPCDKEDNDKICTRGKWHAIAKIAYKYCVVTCVLSLLHFSSGPKFDVFDQHKNDHHVRNDTNHRVRSHTQGTYILFFVKLRLCSECSCTCGIDLILEYVARYV